MKKLLICVSLLLVLVCAVVACKNTGNNEDTTPATSESVTESGTAEPNNETSNNLDPTPTEPAPDGDDTTVPGGNDTTVKDEETTEPEETTTEFKYDNYEELGEGKSSPDTYKENGTSLKDGAANDWLAENRPDGISTIGLQSIGFRGWAFIKDVTFTEFGYAFDNDQATEKWGFEPIDDEALHAPLGTDARRYDITITFDGVSAGEHTLYLLAKDSEGKIYKIGRWGDIKVKVETYADLPALPTMSADNWYENGTQMCNGELEKWFTDNRPDGVNLYGLTSVGVRGWAGGIGDDNNFVAFGYAFGNNPAVWLEDAVKDAEGPVQNAGGSTAKRYEFTINVADIEMGYEGTLYILAKTSNGTIYYMNRWVLNVYKLQYKSTDAPFHTSIDFVNGTGPNGGTTAADAYQGRGGNTNAGGLPDVIEGVNSPLANNTVTVRGWFACIGGVEKYVYTVDGVNWFDCTGELANRADIYNHAHANIAYLKECDETLGNNAGFDALAADLSAFGGQKVDVTFAAVPANAKDTAIPFVTIAGVQVPNKVERGEYQKTSNINMYNGGQGGPLSPNKEFGYKFTVADDKWLNAISIINMPTFSDPNTTGTFKLYIWDTDYATTVAGKPIFEKTIENHADCSTLTVDVSELNLKGGTYLWVAQSTVAEEGKGWTPWVATEKSVEGYQAFYDGNVHDGFMASITVAENAEAPNLPEGCVFAAEAEDIYNAANGANGKNNTDITISEDKSYVTVTSTGGDPWIMAVSAGANQSNIGGSLYVIVVRNAVSGKSYNMFSGSGAGPVAADQSATLTYPDEAATDKWYALGIGGQHGGYANGMNYFRYDFYADNDGSMDIQGIYFFGANVNAFNAFLKSING